MRPLLVLLAAALAGCAAPLPAAEDVLAASEAAPSDCLAGVAGLDLQRATVADLQAAMADGRLTSVALVDAYLARIEAFEPKVNAVQTVAADAREQAARLDAERAGGVVRGPLHGIPVLLKDNVGTNDMPTTAGSIALAENVPPEDATLTARLREAGAVVLGKAQLSEFANWVSLNMPNGYSSLGGQVVNAYTGGDPSGSSSGSGVAGSMAFAAVTIGTETSGSILSPSNANSLVGVKPTLGLVSRAGVIPLAGNFDTPGPMVRTVHDAAALLAAVAGPDERDAATAGAPADVEYVAALAPDALQGARLGYVASEDPIYRDALAALESLGAELVPVDTRDLDIIFLLEYPLIPNEFKAGLNRYLAEEAGPGLPVRTLTDIVLYNQQHPDKVRYGQDLLIASDAQAGSLLLADALAAPVVAANRAYADELFASYGVDAIVGRNAPLTGLGAAAGYPTVVVPAGYDGREPVGLSFFGPAWSEDRLLGYAYAYEQATSARVPPTALNPSLLEGVCAPAAAATSAAPAPAASLALPRLT